MAWAKGGCFTFLASKSAMFERAIQKLDESLPQISCSSCRALCCRLEVRLIEDDDFKVPIHLTEKTADLYTVMKRSDADGWCLALDRKTMLCTIYEKRPFVCREYQAGDYDCLNERKKLNQK